ncbi:MAG TPA: hypothetical protein VJ812_09100 [Gemmatimonadaceae bacterium]|nr:hypothetical protein [Gemmatimonadaceae bacterium]
MTSPQRLPEESRRQWADIAVIVVGVALLGLAIWGGPILTGVDDEIAYAHAVWLVYAGAGALAIAGVIAAQRWSTRGLGRALVIVAALGLLASLFAFRDLGARAWFATILPALIFLIASRSLGPLPPPT